MSALWKYEKIRPLGYRIIWWLMDAGAIGKYARRGWQQAAARQLSVHRITLRRQVQLLVEAGILSECEEKGFVKINPGVFDSHAEYKAGDE